MHTNTVSFDYEAQILALRWVCFIDKTTTSTVADNPELPDAVSREHAQSQRFSVINEVRQTERKKDNMMKREAGRILLWRSRCSRCSRPASNYARRLSFCLPACHPVCQFSRDREAGRGERRDERGDAGAARGKSVGHRRSQLKVTWPFDFVTCHQLPCLSLRWGVPAIHRCLPLSECLSSFSVSRSCSHSVSFLILLFLPVLWGGMWRCDFRVKLRYNGQISL